MSATAPLTGEPGWPDDRGLRVVFLLDASSAVERELLVAWIGRHRPATDRGKAAEWIPIPSTRRRPRRPAQDARLEAVLASGEDVLLAPLRVIWRPAVVDGERRVRLRDLLTTGDPRDPGPLWQRWILSREGSRERCRIVAGEPASALELRRRWHGADGHDASQTQGLAEFVARQAALALERAERRARGARYKVPRLVHEDVLSRPAFRGDVARLARELGKSEAGVSREAQACLREIAATHSPYVIDLVAGLIRLLYTRGYGEALHYDRNQLEGVAGLSQRHPVVFLPSHKSNLDHLVLQYALWENGHPPNHTAGGINMNFFPVGPLVRRSGVFFIRRTFKDQPVYKLVLQHYVDYLIEKRFSLEWYIEGGRSRSGKLLPPRFGLLAYVVDAFRRGKSEDVFLIPVSIAYDQIQDVGSYVAEQRGAAKEKESFSWFVRMVRALGRRYGNIHIRFGEPLSLLATLGPPEPGAAPNPDEQNLALQKLAFEVSVRINRATPVTPTSLVTMALLGIGDQAATVEEITAALANLVESVEERKLPTTGPLELHTAEGVRRALETLRESGVVTCYDEGPEPVWAIDAEQHLTAAYYRNTIIHFFVNGAIAELALLRAAEPDVADPLAEFWSEAFALRDLLKFEFFFADKESFRAELAGELALQDSEWQQRVADGPAGIEALVRRIRPFTAHRVLRPFLEAYRVAAETLAHRDPALPFDEDDFAKRCLALARQQLLQRRLRRAESVSKVLFATAVRVARNRSLVDPGAADLATRRRLFADELRRVVQRIDAIDALAAARRVGLME
jgi:glycerol-3-phosphate O-acyltransferase